jgi:hypothetical protein
VNTAAGEAVEFTLRCEEDIVTAPTDVDFSAEFEESLGSSFAEAGASAGDEDAFIEQEIFLKHDSRPEARERLYRFVRTRERTSKG